MLLEYLAAEGDRRELAFEFERAADFAADLQRGPGSVRHEPAWHLALAALRCAFQKGPFSPSPNLDLNEQIASSLVSSLPPDLFDSSGLLKSLWLLRLDAKTTDTQGMLAELISIDEPTRGHLAGTQRSDGPHLGRRRPRF